MSTPDDLQHARATWEGLAARARGLHCPEHFAAPWRVVVVGETKEEMTLQIYGCCAQLGVVVDQMIKSDPQVGGPS
jgi:hypothetical protein